MIKIMDGERMHMLQAFASNVIRKCYGPGREAEQTDFLNRNLSNRIGYAEKTACPLFIHFKCYLFQQPSLNIKTPWSESASELYRPSDRRLSAK
jgi:hypothetical protein